MKKYFFFLLTSFFVVSVWAQSPGTGARENFRQREPVSVSGTLVLANGFIALKSGDTIYYAGGLERLVGFIDGLKENAQVRLEGYDFSRVNNVRTQDSSQTEATHFLRVTRLEIDSRSYEISPMAGGFPEQGPRNFHSRHGFGPMHGRPDFDRPGFGRRGNGPPGFGKPGSGRHRGNRFGGGDD
ncbi:MAG: hypothetical protein LBP69_05070 [Treponema sp.]|jgi:hypothetical protein|nr:hypothetical protein [Treponema sp.]